MAKKSGDGGIFPNPRDETDNLHAYDLPAWPEDELYVTYGQCMKNQDMEGASLADTPNTRSSDGIMGGPAPGELSVLGKPTNN